MGGLTVAQDMVIYQWDCWLEICDDLKLRNTSRTDRSMDRRSVRHRKGGHGSFGYLFGFRNFRRNTNVHSMMRHVLLIISKSSDVNLRSEIAAC